MAHQIVTLWDPSDLARAVHSARTAAVLTATKPQGIQLHARAQTLAEQGPALTEYARAHWPELEVGWAVAGDWAVPSVPGPVPYWAECGHAAEGAGVPYLQLDCEAAWLNKPEIAARALSELHAAVPCMELRFTSYGSPMDHLTFPWQAFLALWKGQRSPIIEMAFQTYFASESHKSDRAYGEYWIRNYAGSIALAYGRGIISPRVLSAIYLQAYWAPCTALCEAIQNSLNVYWWNCPENLDTEGQYAIASLAELHRRGLTVSEFQQSAGLTVDGLVGPKTREALGIPVVMP